MCPPVALGAAEICWWETRPVRCGPPGNRSLGEDRQETPVFLQRSAHRPSVSVARRGILQNTKGRSERPAGRVHIFSESAPRRPRCRRNLLVGDAAPCAAPPPGIRSLGEDRQEPAVFLQGSAPRPPVIIARRGTLQNLSVRSFFGSQRALVIRLRMVRWHKTICRRNGRPVRTSLN